MTKGTILVIDDESATSNFEGLKNAIKAISTDYSYEFIEKGEDGINKVRGDENIKMVILDNMFVNQLKQGGDILKEIRNLRSDLPIVMLSQLSRNRIERSEKKEKHPPSKTAKRLGATIYIEKVEFINELNKVRNIILSILQKPPYTMILDCKKKTLNIIDQKGKTILRELHQFSNISGNWKKSMYPYNKDHFLFKLIYKAAKKHGDRGVLLSDVFKIQKSVTYKLPTSFDSLISTMKEVRPPKDRIESWQNILEEFTSNPFDVEKIDNFLQNSQEYSRRFLSSLEAYKEEVEEMTDIHVHKTIYDFNNKICENSEGRILQLLTGSGHGNRNNRIKISVETVKIEEDSNKVKTSPVAHSNYVTKEELRNALESFKVEISSEIENKILSKIIK